MIRSYLPAIVFLALGAIVGGTFAFLNAAFGPRRRIPAKTQPYECGLPSDVKQGFRFGISFYLIAMLFILFDIETFFLFPVAVQLRAYGAFALGEAITFVVLYFILARVALPRIGEVIEDENPEDPDARAVKADLHHVLRSPSASNFKQETKCQRQDD